MLTTAPVLPRTVMTLLKLSASGTAASLRLSKLKLKGLCPSILKQTRNVPSMERERNSLWRAQAVKRLFRRATHFSEENTSSTSGHRLAVCEGNKFTSFEPARIASSTNLAKHSWRTREGSIYFSYNSPKEQNIETFAQNKKTSDRISALTGPGIVQDQLLKNHFCKCVCIEDVSDMSSKDIKDSVAQCIVPNKTRTCIKASVAHMLKTYSPKRRWNHTEI